MLYFRYVKHWKWKKLKPSLHWEVRIIFAVELEIGPISEHLNGKLNQEAKEQGQFLRSLDPLTKYYCDQIFSYEFASTQFVHWTPCGDHCRLFSSSKPTTNIEAGNEREENAISSGRHNLMEWQTPHQCIQKTGNLWSPRLQTFLQGRASFPCSSLNFTEIIQSSLVLTPGAVWFQLLWAAPGGSLNLICCQISLILNQFTSKN